MEKKVSGLSPGKSYVLRFRPEGSEPWSKNYEFTVPKPTTTQLNAGTSGVKSSKIITTVKTTSNKGFSSEAVCAWDVAIENDYGAWSSTDNQKIYCLLPGWYQAALQTTFDTDLGGSGDQLACIIDKTSGATTTRLAEQSIPVAYGTTFFMSLSTQTTLVYCNAGDYFRAYVYAGSGGTGTLVPNYSTLTPLTQFSVTYLGP